MMMRTRRSSECRVAIVHPNLQGEDLERLQELSHQYPKNYVEIYEEESKVPDDIICRISIFCEKSTPFSSYVTIVDEKDGEEFAVKSEKKFRNVDELIEGLGDIVKEATDTDTDSEREHTPLMHHDSEEQSSPTIRHRPAVKPEKKSPLKRHEPQIISRKGMRKNKKSEWSDSPSFSEPETKEPQKGDKEPLSTDGKQKSQDIHLLVVLVIFAVLFPLLYLYNVEENSMKSLPERYREELKNLKLTHHKQDARFWRVVNATMKSHIIDEDPRQPAVLMVASSSQTSATREKLTHQIARIYSMRCNGTDSMKVDGTAYSSFDHATAKKRLDTEIHSGFAAGSCAVVISNFEELPPASTTVFYQFCENDYAPYKKALILFTTEITDWNWMGEDQARFLSEDKTPKPQFWNRVIESFLEFSLQNKDDSGKMTADMIGGLLTRITPLVAWVGDE